MNYFPIKFQDKILRNVEVIKKNANRLVLFWTPFMFELIELIQNMDREKRRLGEKIIKMKHIKVGKEMGKRRIIAS